MLQRTLTALVTSALLGAVLLIAPAPSAAASLVQETISAGLVHTCALTSAGAAYCWGENGDGRLGDGTSGTDRLTPTTVSGGLKFTSISAGAYHTCAVTSAGAAYCWGYNGDGQVGDGTSGTNRLTPTAVSGGLKFASIGAGAYHNCGLTSAGAAFCWGDNGNGQLGDGTGTDRLTPTAVSGGLKFTSVSAGRYHTCAITTTGAASCWGVNWYGQVGDGTNDNQLTPTAVSGGLKFTSISAGGYHTCAVTSGGAAFCWGSNGDGQLGDGTSGSDRLTPTAVSGGLKFAHISAGAYHTCAITTTGVASCWGWNGYGQLGDGTSGTDRLTPTAVSGGLKFAHISAGRFHTCGLTSAGAASCWGVNESGRLGDGTSDNRLTPTAVSGGLKFALGGGDCDRSSRSRERCRPTR